jgi:hypothetical protein
MNFITFKSTHIEGSIQHFISSWLPHVKQVLKYGHVSIDSFCKLSLINQQMPFCSILFTEVPYNPLSSLKTPLGDWSYQFEESLSGAVFPLTCYVQTFDQEIKGFFEYDIECYEENTISQLSQQWMTFLSTIVLNSPIDSDNINSSILNFT